ncbi:hypothetical protein H310_05725 [Aphanomyces invadans]|uniref:Nitroreductase domain-containing protein n=1 Tax=Aphanomyces invadans TaxID=157072 RepID=A0A024U8C5_9STRA|nr:hypothetical protein H310_05725 [Aphanomyces invadans]ETW02152.1 hypothetical protein H310_05725 [Aphanomyces invadans]|eukprot:XP_008868757.1 hypothetical protein H310_05725 [Aphanomyces invadans]
MAAQAFRSLARQRRSLYKFQNKDIPKDILKDILLTTQRAPSGFNLQPYACMLVQDPTDRNALSAAMLGDNVRKVKEAPLIAVFAADLEPSKRVPAIQEMMATAGQSTADIQQLPLKLRFFGGEGHLAGVIRSGISTALTPFQPVPTYVPTIAWSYKSTMLAVSQYILAAESHGIGSCVMEGFDETWVRHALDIPDRYSVPVVVASGYAAAENSQPPSPRLDPSQVFFGAKFGAPTSIFDEE